MMPTMGSLPAGDVALIAEAKKTRKSRLDRRDYFALVDPSTFEQVTDTRSLRRP